MDGAKAGEGMKEGALVTLNAEAPGLKEETLVFIPGAPVGGPDGTKTGAFWFIFGLLFEKVRSTSYH
jgi:hypothetical protein